MPNQIWIAGYPSFYGGADTELDHNIDLWRRFGIARAPGSHAWFGPSDEIAL